MQILHGTQKGQLVRQDSSGNLAHISLRTPMHTLEAAASSPLCPNKSKRGVLRRPDRSRAPPQPRPGSPTLRTIWEFPKIRGYLILGVLILGILPFRVLD